MQFNSIDFLAESLIHHNSFIIEEEENDMTAKNNIMNNNNNESLVVDIDTNVGKQAQTTKRRKESEIKTKNKTNNLMAFGSNKAK